MKKFLHLLSSKNTRQSNETLLHMYLMWAMGFGLPIFIINGLMLPLDDGLYNEPIYTLSIIFIVSFLIMFWGVFVGVILHGIEYLVQHLLLISSGIRTLIRIIVYLGTLCFVMLCIITIINIALLDIDFKKLGDGISTIYQDPGAAIQRDYSKD